jgi:hypothetical protein
LSSSSPTPSPSTTSTTTMSAGFVCKASEASLPVGQQMDDAKQLASTLRQVRGLADVLN